MSAWLNLRNAFVFALVVMLALVPVYAALIGNYFLMSLFTRIVILAMAAVSLNLIMGFGGMVSFGHAAYLGIGGYAIGILAKEGINSGFLQWPLALAMSALFALAVGALSLRTRGVYFIMITLAFAQMVYYVAIGLDRYGGDDGMTIYKRSQFGGLIDLSNKTAFYYLCLVLLLVAVYIVWRIVNSRFGMVIQGARSNDRRMRAIGFPTYRYKLICFVIAGTICGLAGALLANHTDFISPAVMHWTRSGDLINLSNKTAFYYLCLVLLLVAVYIVWRIVNSRFGMVIQGARSNDRRMRAIGFPTYRYKLVCFVIAGTMCGLAGALLANHTDFISPAVMHWTRSGDLIVMAVLGGMGTVFGPVIGAVALLVLEEVLSGVTEYWQIIMGPIFLLVVLFARGGIDGVLLGARRD